MKVAILIDGGYLRANARAAERDYSADFIEKVSRLCLIKDEYLLRVFYYDSPLYKGSVDLPVSGRKHNFQASDKWLHDIARLERFAVRQGTLGFRGWKPKEIPIAGISLTDQHFSPVFEQKGVDMRIGLDIANFCNQRSVDRIILVSGDQDVIPAMKHARKSGLEVSVVQLSSPTRPLSKSLLQHTDTVRTVPWPAELTTCPISDPPSAQTEQSEASCPPAATDAP